MNRIIVETPCVHDSLEGHSAVIPNGGVWCEGGSRELSEFSQEAIEAAAFIKP